jgi:hypothetical protein
LQGTIRFDQKRSSGDDKLGKFSLQMTKQEDIHYEPDQFKPEQFPWYPNRPILSVFLKSH